MKGGEKVDNSNIIISVIIVLCIAAGVTAYGISEGDNAVFTDLSGFSPDSSSSGNDGIGNASNGNANNGSGSLISAPANSGGSGSGSGSSSGGSGSGSGSGSGGGSQTTDIGYDASLQKAQSLAGDAAFVSSSDAGTYRIFYFKKSMPVSNQSNYTTDTFAISVDKATGAASLY